MNVASASVMCDVLAGDGLRTPYLSVMRAAHRIHVTRKSAYVRRGSPDGGGECTL